MNELKFAGNWSEEDIVNSISGFREPDFLKIGGNSFCHKIIKTLMQKNLLTENTGHDCKPPDYYSEELNIMFDVMRVNDSEQKKGYNPVFQEMSKFTKEVQKSLKQLGMNDVITVMTDLKSDNGLDYDEIHQFRYYKRHVLRVLNEHIKKIPIWCTEHPTITRKGFVVLDEAGLYFQGYANPAMVAPNGYVEKWKFFIKKPVIVHYPWKDTEFMQPLLNADLDFLVWYRPYAKMSEANQTFFQGQCPNLAIIDLRKKTTFETKNYNVTDEWISWM